MFSFFNEIIHPANIHATLLLALALLYWAMVIVGAIGMDAFDIDLDADLDLDADIDVDADADFGLDGGGSLLGAVMTFFHVGDVPIMLIFSFFSISFWVSTVLLNHYVNPELDITTALVWMIPCVVIALGFTKICVTPIAPLLRAEKTEFSDRRKLIGQIVEVNTLELNDKFGEILVGTKGPPLVLNARTQNGQKLRKGDRVKVVGLDESNNCIVELAKWESSKI